MWKGNCVSWEADAVAVVAVVMAVMAVTCNELRSHDTAQPSRPTQPTPVLQQPSSGGHPSQSRSHESTGISPGPGLRHYYNQSGPSNSQHSQCNKSFISVRRKSCPQIPRSCHQVPGQTRDCVWVRGVTEWGGQGRQPWILQQTPTHESNLVTKRLMWPMRSFHDCPPPPSLAMPEFLSAGASEDRVAEKESAAVLFCWFLHGPCST